MTSDDKGVWSEDPKLVQEKDQEIIKYAYENLNNIGDLKGDNYERMISGMLYYSFGDTQVRHRDEVTSMCDEYSSLRARNYHSASHFYEARTQHLNKFLGHMGKEAILEPPFRCDFGCNTSIGDYTFINYNFQSVDVSLVRIGAHCLIGPSCSLVTATHPNSVDLRTCGLENGRAVTIEDKVWLGANVTVLPGVTVGHGSIVGAGSVVTKDVPPYSVAVGVPARVVKTLKKEDPNFDKEAFWKSLNLNDAN